MSSLLTENKSWLRQSFLSQIHDIGNDVEKVDDFNPKYFTSSKMKYVDTFPGGSKCINPPPQFTKYADVKAPNIFTLASGRNTSVLNTDPNRIGDLGRVYSEVFDDNYQVIHLRFGVPRHNSMMDFFNRSYNYKVAITQKTGRQPGFLYSFGKGVAFIVSIRFYPLLAFSLVNKLSDLLGKYHGTKYYYLKPTMPLYWMTVQTIVNQIAVDTGLRERLFQAVDRADQSEVLTRQEHDGIMTGRHGFANVIDKYPRLFLKSGEINVPGIISRYMTRTYVNYKVLKKVFGDRAARTITEYNNMLSKYATSLSSGIQNKDNTTNDGEKYVQYFDMYNKSMGGGGGGNTGKVDLYKYESTIEVKHDSDNKAANESEGAWDSFTKDGESNSNSFGEYLETSLEDGFEFVSFKVVPTGAVSESWSNSTTVPDIDGIVNGKAQEIRKMMFSFAGGQIGSGIIQNVANAVISGASDIIGGAADAMGVAGILAPLSGSITDFQKVWDSSSSSTSSMNYKIELPVAYNNPISKMIYETIPIAMCLAGGLPRGTGSQSYTSPFICELYDPGRVQSRLAIISSINISRGNGNLGWGKNNRANGITIDLTVEDLSQTMFMNVSNNLNSGILGLLDVVGNAMLTLDTIVSADTAFSDYLSVLSGLGLADMIYPWAKIFRNIELAKSQWRTTYSKASIAMRLGDTAFGRLGSMFYEGIKVANYNGRHKPAATANSGYS